MSASPPATEHKARPRARNVAVARFPLWFAATEGARAALRVDSCARLPQLPDDARHRDRRRVGHRDGVDHPGLERHDRPAVRRVSAATA